MRTLNYLSFGPVPSRRLGVSLGVNNIPPKNCTYNCIYCQLRMQSQTSVDLRKFYSPKEIINSVKNLLSELQEQKIDYITIVPDGEATLDINLKELISRLRLFGLPLAIITNASLMALPEIRETLLDLDLVSIKIDAVTEKIFKRINRPNIKIILEEVLEGIKSFSKEYKGILISETMLVSRVDYSEEIRNIAVFLKKLQNLHSAYLSVPTRPPTVLSVGIPDYSVIEFCYSVFSDTIGIDQVSLLIGYEGDDFGIADDMEHNLLSIMSVHPMRKEAIEAVLKERNMSWALIESLIEQHKILKIYYEGFDYFLTIHPASKSRIE